MMRTKDLACTRCRARRVLLLGFLTWVFVGLVAGLVAQVIVSGGIGGIGLRSLLLTILLGIGGALLGGFVASAMGWGDVTGFNVRSLVIATLGAVAVIIVWNALSKRLAGGRFA